MDSMDSTVANVALPRITQEFQATTSSLEWVVSGYLLSLAVLIPAAGWLGDRYGTKRIFLLSLSILLAGSALSGAAWGVESLAVFRVLQGDLGGGPPHQHPACQRRHVPARSRAGGELRQYASRGIRDDHP